MMMNKPVNFWCYITFSTWYNLLFNLLSLVINTFLSILSFLLNHEFIVIIFEMTYFLCLSWIRNLPIMRITWIDLIRQIFVINKNENDVNEPMRSLPTSFIIVAFDEWIGVEELSAISLLILSFSTIRVTSLSTVIIDNYSNESTISIIKIIIQASTPHT